MTNNLSEPQKDVFFGQILFLFLVFLMTFRLANYKDLVFGVFLFDIFLVFSEGLAGLFLFF